MKGLEAQMFVSAPKVVESRNVRVTIQPFHFKISFNLMLAAAASVLFIRSYKPFLFLNFFEALGNKSFNH